MIMTYHNYRSRPFHRTWNGVNRSSGFTDMGCIKSGLQWCQFWQAFSPWASPYGANGQTTMMLHNQRSRQFYRTLNRTFRYMHSAKSGPKWCTKFDKFLPHGQAIMRPMGKWLWCCTTSGQDNSIELQMEKICLEVSEICILQSLNKKWAVLSQHELSHTGGANEVCSAIIRSGDYA